MITKKNLLTALLFLFVSCPMWSQILKSSGIIVKAGKGEIAYNTPTHIGYRYKKFLYKRKSSP